MSPTDKQDTTPAPHRPLEGKVVIVTGGNSGIGEGIVREAAAPYTSDHYFAPDIARATDGVRAGRYRAFAADLLPSA